MTDAYRTSLTAAIDRLIASYARQESSEAEGETEYPFVGEDLDHSKLRPIGLEDIERRDPGFTLAAFLEHVGEMFAVYHDALDRADPSRLGRFAIEPVLTEATQAIRDTGPTSMPCSYLITSIQPEVALREEDFDLIRVAISARRVIDDAFVEPVRERWRCVRVRDVSSRSHADLAHCPSCGAPVDGDDPNICSYCGRSLADPGLDWVVGEIEPL